MTRESFYSGHGCLAIRGVTSTGRSHGHPVSRLSTRPGGQKRGRSRIRGASGFHPGSNWEGAPLTASALCDAGSTDTGWRRGLPGLPAESQSPCALLGGHRPIREPRSRERRSTAARRLDADVVVTDARMMSAIGDTVASLRLCYAADVFAVGLIPPVTGDCTRHRVWWPEAPRAWLVCPRRGTRAVVRDGAEKGLRRTSVELSRDALPRGVDPS